MSQTYAGQPIQAVVIIDKSIPSARQTTFSTGETSSPRPQAQTFTPSGPYRDASGKFARRPVAAPATPSRSAVRQPRTVAVAMGKAFGGGLLLGFSDSGPSSQILNYRGVSQPGCCAAPADPTVPQPVRTTGKKNSLATAVDNTRKSRIIDLCLSYSRALIDNTNLSAEQLEQSNRWAYREPYNTLYKEAATRYRVSLVKAEGTIRLDQLIQQIGSLEALNLATELFASFEANA